MYHGASAVKVVRSTAVLFYGTYCGAKLVARPNTICATDRDAKRRLGLPLPHKRAAVCTLQQMNGLVTIEYLRPAMFYAPTEALHKYRPLLGVFC